MGYLAQLLSVTVFLPRQGWSVAILLLVLAVEWLVGFWVVRRSPLVGLAWCFPLVSVWLVHLSLFNERPGFRMGALILVLLLGMKVVTAYAYRHLPFGWRTWAWYTLTWVGMNPTLFFEQGHRQDSGPFLRRGLRGLLSGALLLGALAGVLHYYDYRTSVATYWLASLLLLVSLSLILHFGLLNLDAAFLRYCGFPAYSLFRAPLQSTSLREFWGKRWNIAFSEMTAAVAYRPLLPVLGRQYALLLSFLFSGLLHVVALSLSVQQTYLLPLAYFLLHGLLMVVENYGPRPPGRGWVVFWLVVPLPMLFHQAVMDQVFWPIIAHTF